MTLNNNCISGNSLGLQPKKLSENIQHHLHKWAHQAVEGHFHQPTPWVTIDDLVTESMARVVGAKPSEVVMMNSLTCNLHFMMSAFYKPTPERFKIITEKKAFPSDTHAVVSQILYHGLDPKTALVEVAPREGEDTLRLEDILEVCIFILIEPLIFPYNHFHLREFIICVRLFARMAVRLRW